MRSRTNIQLVFVVFLTVCLYSSVTAKTIYVDINSPGPVHDGTSWETAYNYLQDALEMAVSGDTIRVAEGTYYPDESIYVPSGSGDRYDTFRLKNGVGIYGGYAGCGEPNENARDTNIYKTILSGDLDGNDDGFFINNDENSYHVVTGSRRNATAVLDGFTITAGNANGYYPEDESGGGMYNYSGNPTVTNCTFKRNSGDLGGGMYNESSDPIVTNCTFSENSADHGGGMCNFDYSTPMVTGCTFYGNSADYFGGGMFNFYRSDINITNSTFSGNSAEWDGGGMYNEESSPTVTNCKFSENSAHYYVGPVPFNYDNITDSTFSSNSAYYEGSGGGMYNEESSPTVTNCIFSDNMADQGGGMYNDSSDPIVTSCIFRGYRQKSGAGIYNYESNPTVVNCTFSGYGEEGGGGMYNINSNPSITNCTFSKISEYYKYQGITNYDSSDSVITNCIIWGCTIYNDGTSSANVTYSDVQYDDGIVYPGTGNINEDPCFVDADGPDDYSGTEDDNLRISPGSPCIDAGDNNALPAGVTTDLDGRDRIIDGDGNSTEIVDMGAYEHPRAIYVDDDAPPGGNGSSWDNAYRYLQDALSVTSSQIFVAEGTYKPDQSGGQNPGDRGASFVLINGMALYGGYAGLGAADPNERDIKLYETILSGDLLGNDDPNTPVYELRNDPCRADNCYYVVIGSYTDETAVLDGFTITDGYGYNGGGMSNWEGSPTVTNCTFSRNSADFGGGMFNGESSPTVTNCTFSENFAWASGGGMENEFSNPTVTNCSFSGNWANLFGGGMFNGASNPTINNCIFMGNLANRFGGGVFNGKSSPIVTKCIFSGNWAKECGGGVCNDNYSSPAVINCSFSGNLAECGNAIACDSRYQQRPSDVNITNCILWDGGDEICNNDGSTITISYSNIVGGWEGLGNIDIDPCFVDAGYWDANGTPDDMNDDFWVDGDYHLRSAGWRWDRQRKLWTWDEVTSRCIDTGNPGSELGQEPLKIPDDPNSEWGINKRINMGAYGGTAEASIPPYDWALLADITNDGTVNFTDLKYFSENWLNVESECPADFNRDSAIDMFDYALFAEDWLVETVWY